MRCMLFLLLAASCSAILAADISRDVREGRQDESIEKGGYFEFSNSIGYRERTVVDADRYSLHFSLGGHYRYKRFFVDALAESYSQFQFGLNGYSGDIWSFDVLMAVSDYGLESVFNDQLRGFNSRSQGLNFGARATAYSGPYIVQFESMYDISDTHNGHLFMASVARQWLRKNWNLHALLGARYQSANAMDYLFGITEQEATERFQVYTASSGTTFVTELGATYPINEHLLFRATGRWWELPTAAVDSPFVIKDSYLTLNAALTFVY